MSRIRAASTRTHLCDISKYVLACAHASCLKHISTCRICAGINVKGQVTHLRKLNYHGALLKGSPLMCTHVWPQLRR